MTSQCGKNVFCAFITEQTTKKESICFIQYKDLKGFYPNSCWILGMKKEKSKSADVIHVSVL